LVDLDATGRSFSGAAGILLYQDIIVFARRKSTAAPDRTNWEKPGAKAS
jgi:hypothetical protein